MFVVAAAGSADVPLPEPPGGGFTEWRSPPMDNQTYTQEAAHVYVDEKIHGLTLEGP